MKISAYWSKSIRLKDKEIGAVIAFWRRELGVVQFVHAERISPYQVTRESGIPGCELVGVVYDSNRAAIYHTRALTGEDIIHELLHVANPSWSEAQVVAETDKLVNEYAAKSKLVRKTLVELGYQTP